MFSNDYVQGAMNQRLGLVLYVAPDFLTDPVAVPFGYTPDPEVIVDKVRSRYPNVPEALIEVMSGIIEDVYWIAIMIQFGLIGLGLFFAAVLWAIRNLARRFRQEAEPVRRNFALLALLLMIVCIPMDFFNQVLLFREFALCIWICFALAMLPRKGLQEHSALV
jgi:hypothetical protein